MEFEPSRQYLSVLQTVQSAFELALDLNSYPSIAEYNAVKAAKEMVEAHIVLLLDI